MEAPRGADDGQGLTFRRGMSARTGLVPAGWRGWLFPCGYGDGVPLAADLRTDESEGAGS